MPVYLRENINPEGEIGVWAIEEPEVFFREKLVLSEIETAQVNRIKSETRRREWLSGRYLLHLMSGREKRGFCDKDSYGRPHLADSQYDISLSHSGKFSAVIAGPMSVGVDIQRLEHKMLRIKHKFLRPEEAAILKPNMALEQCHIFWGAKEAVYKAYGKKELAFLKNISIEPFDNVTSGSMNAYIIKEELKLEFKIHFRKIENYYLVYAIEK